MENSLIVLIEGSHFQTIITCGQESWQIYFAKLNIFDFHPTLKQIIYKSNLDEVNFFFQLTE
jgi:hypothetical protein